MEEALSHLDLCGIRGFSSTERGNDKGKKTTRTLRVAPAESEEWGTLVPNKDQSQKEQE